MTDPTPDLRAALERLDRVPSVALSYPKGPQFIEHDEGCGYAFGNSTFHCYCFIRRSAARAALAAPAADGLDVPPEALDWARQLMAQGYVDEHFVTFDRTGYGLQHPIRCRPDLIGCKVNKYLASHAPQRPPGRYLVTWEKNGPRRLHYEPLREPSREPGEEG